MGDGPLYSDADDGGHMLLDCHRIAKLGYIAYRQDVRAGRNDLQTMSSSWYAALRMVDSNLSYHPQSKPLRHVFGLALSFNSLILFSSGWPDVKTTVACRV